ncbi:MAG: hypothetical protein ABIN69_07285 [Aestuariivirga sp.]
MGTLNIGGEAGQQQPNPFDQFDSKVAPGVDNRPIRVTGPDGTRINFPPGTAKDVMERVLQDHYAGWGNSSASPQQPPANAPAGGSYDLQTLENAFMKADAAGDTQAAQALATEIKAQRAMPKGTANPFDQFDAPAGGDLSLDNVARSVARGVPVAGGLAIIVKKQSIRKVRMPICQPNIGLVAGVFKAYPLSNRHE